MMFSGPGFCKVIGWKTVVTQAIVQGAGQCCRWFFQCVFMLFHNRAVRFLKDETLGVMMSGDKPQVPKVLILGNSFWVFQVGEFQFAQKMPNTATPQKVKPVPTRSY